MLHRWFHRKVVNEIKTFIGADRTLCNLRKETAPAITLFDKVIVDGSMHTRQIQKKLREFCKTNQKERLKTEIDLFRCCMEDGKKAYAELEQVYSSELITLK